MDELNLDVRGGAERCPYCHDQLAEERAELIVRCEGCGTQHHAVCLAELGRCTVLGCEKPEGQQLPDQLPSSRSGVGRIVRQRIRSRVRNFVRRNVTPAVDPARLRELKAYEDQVFKWQDDFLEEALRNPTPYDPEQLRIIRKTAQNRGLVVEPGTFAALLREWPDQNLRDAAGKYRDQYALFQRFAIERELKRRGLEP